MAGYIIKRFSHYYTKSHEWYKFNSSNNITIGLTNYAIKNINEVIYIEFPTPEDEVSDLEPIIEIETTKTSQEIVSPDNCKIIECNSEIDLEYLNNLDIDETEKWLVRISTENHWNLDTQDPPKNNNIELLNNDDYISICGRDK